MRRMSLCAAGAWWVVGRMELCCRGALFAGGRWHFSAAEAGLSKNLRYFAVLKFHKRYFMTVEYHQRNFSTVKSGSHCGAFQGRPALPLPLVGKGQIHDPTNALGGESAILTFFGALNSKSAFPPI